MYIYLLIENVNSIYLERINYFYKISSKPDCKYFCYNRLFNNLLKHERVKDIGA